MWKLENFISFSLKLIMSIVCHGKLPTGQSGDLEAGPGDLTGLSYYATVTTGYQIGKIQQQISQRLLF